MQSESRQRFASQFDYDDQQGSTAASDNTRFVPQLNEMAGGFDEYNYQFERGVYLGAQHQAGLFPGFPSSGLMDFNDIPRDTKIGFDMEGASAFAAPGAHDSNFPAGFLDDMIDPVELEQPYTQDFGIDGGRWINGLPPTPAFAQPDGQMVYAYSQTAQPGNPTFHQPDLGVGATTPWLSAPFGASQWSAPKAVDQPMADALHAWDASFTATATPVPTPQTRELGATHASIPAGAG